MNTTTIKIIIWIMSTPFILLGLFIVARFLFCVPDRGAVNVMQPVAKIIAEDIVKNGIPASLKDIEGLPYVLEEYDGWMSEIIPMCYFEKNNKKYEIGFIYLSSSTIQLRIFNKETQTGIKYYFQSSKLEEKDSWILEKNLKNPKIFDSKTSGICTSFRQ